MAAGDNVLLQHGAPYAASKIPLLIPELNTESWYRTQQACLRWDPTRISSRYLFSDVPIPRGKPLDPGAASHVCRDSYVTAWPMEQVSAAYMVDTEMNYPQFAFQAAYGPATRYQIEVESELRTLNTPLGQCTQPVIPMDAPLFRNEVAPPPSRCLDPHVQNACNPLAVIIGPGETPCRRAADEVANSMSFRWVNNPTRQDTMRMNLPFAPPGIGSGAPRTSALPVSGQPYFTNAPQGLAAPPMPVPPIYNGERFLAYAGGKQVTY